MTTQIFLNPIDQREFAKISNALSLDSQTKDSALNLYHQYIRNSSLILKNNAENLQISFASAILVASKSQIVVAINGEKKRGVGISFAHVIKHLKSLEFKNHIIQDFLISLDNFLNAVIIDDTIQQELRELVGQFKFIQKLFYKYEELFLKMALKNRTDETQDKSEILNNIKNLGWILFSILRRRMFNHDKDIVNHYCLLLIIIYLILQNLPKHFHSDLIKDITNMESTPHNQSKKIIAKLCQIIKLNDIEDFLNKYKRVSIEIQELAEQLHLKYTFSNLNDINNFNFFNDETLLFNYNKLENFLQKDLELSEDIDERCFLKSKNLTPIKFTPFLKQGEVNKFIYPNSLNEGPYKKLPGSSRMLNYDTTLMMNEDLKLNELKQRIQMSPFPKKITLANPCSTPMTVAMELYNWLNDMTKVVKSNEVSQYETPNLDNYCKENVTFSKENLLERSKKLIDNILSKTHIDINDKEFRGKQVLMLYLTVLEKHLFIRSRTPEMLENKMHNSLIACCLEILFFILNNTDIVLTTLFDLCSIDSFDFWTKIRFFIELDFFLPNTLKENFLELEKMIMFIYSWKNGSFISSKILSKVNQNTDNSNIFEKNEILSQEEFFFKRLLHLTAIQIQDLAEVLKLDNLISENSWKLMKEILSKETSIFINRNIVQFILCCIYSISRMFSNEHSLTFQQIILKYMTLPYTKKNSHFVLFSFNEKGEKLNVIEFYNQFFLLRMKNYLKNLKEDPQNANRHIYATPRPMIPSLITSSPLKLFTEQSKFTSPFRKLLVEPNMTPFSAALYVKDDPMNKIFKKDFENPGKKICLLNQERPNNSLLNRIKNKYEGYQPTLLLKNNSKLLTEGENAGNIVRGVSRSLFGEGKIEEIDENTLSDISKND